MNSGRVLAGNDGGTTTTNGVLPMPAIGAMSRMKLKLRFGYSVALTALVETGITIVYPSAAEFTTYSVPMLPPKPGLFSITNCWPRRSDSHCPACITANSTHSCLLWSDSGQMADVSIRPPRASANCGRHQLNVYQYGALACINRANRSQICPLCLQWREQQPGEKRQPRRDLR